MIREIHNTSTFRCFREMSDERFFVTESNEEKFEDKNSQDNDESTKIVVENQVNDQSRESCGLVEKNFARTSERVVVSCQEFCRVCRDIPDDLIDKIKRDFPSIKNCGISRIPGGLKRSKDDDPNVRYTESTYFCEPIHHERNVVEDSKGDKFILSEVAEYTGTRSPSPIEYHEEEVNCVTGNNDNDNQGVIFFNAMDKSSKSVIDDSQRVSEEFTDAANDEDQLDHNTRDVVKIDNPSEFHGSPELRRKFSKTSAVRDDARRLKTATLDRMGKMFKLKSTQASNKDCQEGPTSSEASENSCAKEQSRKERANSLGRMFKLVDKNGMPRKLFPQSRTGSLSHILRRKFTGAEENSSMENSNNRGVFSRLFKQWKNRSESGNATEEPNLCVSTAIADKSSSAKSFSTSKINLSSSFTNPPFDPTPQPQRSPPTDVDYPA